MPKVDFAALRRKMTEAARWAFTEVQENHPKERFYAFALPSDDGAMTVEPAANSEEALERAADGDEDTLAWMRWSTSEWTYETEGGDHFNDVYDAINADDRYDEDDEGAFGAFKEKLFETMILALEDLDAKGFFGKGKARSAVTLFCSVTDSEDAEKLEDESARRLNPAAVYRRFAARPRS